MSNMWQMWFIPLAAVLAVRRALLETRLRAIDIEAQRADLRARLTSLFAQDTP